MIPEPKVLHKKQLFIIITTMLQILIPKKEKSFHNVAILHTYLFNLLNLPTYMQFKWYS